MACEIDVFAMVELVNQVDTTRQIYISQTNAYLSGKYL